jgi:hypothetical protein
MDNFLERLIVKKKTRQDNIFKVLVISAGILAAFLILTIQFVSLMSPIIDAAIIFIVYYLIKNRNIEFEYTLTNGDLDIDVIIGRKKRIRAFSSNCKSFDIVAKYDDGKYEKYSNGVSKRLVFVSSLDSPEVYFAVLDYKGIKTAMFFEPSEQMLAQMKIYIPMKVIN